MDPCLGAGSLNGAGCGEGGEGKREKRLFSVSFAGSNPECWNEIRKR